MVTAPVEVAAGVVVQLAIPALPLTLQLTVPVGALAPRVPVTTALKVRVEPSDPPPVPLRTTVGVTWAMTTVSGEVAGSAL